MERDTRSKALDPTKGFRLHGANVTIGGTNIKGYTVGIYLESSSGNTISGNNITNNNLCGIYLGAQGGGSNNTIHHNNFINCQVRFESGTSYGNIWDDGYPSGGNYWSDYVGTDIYGGPNQDEPGSDGIGNMSYIIDTNNQDCYPLMHPFGSPPPSTYRLTINAATNGTTDPAPGNYTYSEGQNVPVQAIPNIGNILDYWELDDANVGATNPLSVTMDTNHDLRPFFSWVGIRNLTITTTTGGTTNPTPGTYTYTKGTATTINATPDIGYMLDRWELDGANIRTANPVNVTMDMNHILHAVFVFVGIHDVAVANVTLSKTVVGQGYFMSINVTVENQGDFTESFNVTVFYDETAITLPDGKNHTTTTLTRGNSTTLTLT